MPSTQTNLIPRYTPEEWAAAFYRLKGGLPWEWDTWLAMGSKVTAAWENKALQNPILRQAVRLSRLERMPGWNDLEV